MPTDRSLAEIETSELIIAVDAGRAAGDLFKLPDWLLALVVTRLADLKLKDSATFTTEGGRAGASLRGREALDALNLLLHDGFKFIDGLLSSQITKADRLELFTKYGWLQGELGDFTDARIESLANQAILVTPTITNAAYRYPAALLTPITAQLTTLNQNQPTATGGDAEMATGARNTALDLTENANERVRFYYCAASDLKDQTPELAKIGKQPRRDKGAAETTPLPGVAAFNTATKTLSVPALPQDATTIRAFRKAAGGVAEQVGSSATSSIAITAPFTPGVAYELWLTGHNFRGDGPESNHVSYTAA